MTSTGNTAVQLVTIDEAHDGQRVDNFLLTHLKGVPKSRIYRLLRKGEVRVNKGRVKPEYRLASGDSVRIPPIRLGDDTPPPKASDAALQRLDDAILYEDAQLIVIDKPSGMAVHGGSGVSFGCIEMLRQMRPEAPFLELVHRLDRETSGCLIIAKKRSALNSLHQQIRDGKVDKYYLALLKGRWKKGAKRVDAPLLKNTLKSGERIVRVDASGKPSLTVFEPVESFEHAALMRIDLGTGRTHQIRVHAQYLERPIAGDDKYGDRDFNAAMAQLGLKRLFLHATELRFLHPESEVTMSVTAPLPDDLAAVLAQLRSARHT
ncbi:MAG: 23S rRNA pseudouridine(955/2504/2580) synthase RluC [Pseudomonadota bacterium]